MSHFLTLSLGTCTAEIFSQVAKCCFSTTSNVLCLLYKEILSLLGPLPTNFQMWRTFPFRISNIPKLQSERFNFFDDSVQHQFFFCFPKAFFHKTTYLFRRFLQFSTHIPTKTRRSSNKCCLSFASFKKLSLFLSTKVTFQWKLG